MGVKRFGVGVAFTGSTALTSILVTLALTCLLRFGAAVGVGAVGVGAAEVAAVVPSAVSVPELARLLRLGAVPPVVGVGVAVGAFGVAAVVPSAVSLPELARLLLLGAVPPVVGVGVAVGAVGVAAVVLARLALGADADAGSGLGSVAFSVIAGCAAVSRIPTRRPPGLPKGLCGLGFFSLAAFLVSWVSCHRIWLAIPLELAAANEHLGHWNFAGGAVGPGTAAAARAASCLSWVRICWLSPSAVTTLCPHPG